jgi:hypothetical protein
MKRWVFVCACMLLASTPALAMDLQGKWGIGAGIIGSTSEIAIMRGHSARTIWALDAAFDQDARSSTGQIVPGKTDRGSVTIGPHLRRFTRATEGLAPYWDVRLDGTYDKSDEGSGPFSNARWDAGLETGLGLGAEYFTPWSFSIALDSDLVSAGFTRSHLTDQSGTTARSTWSTVYFTHLGVHPLLLARAYF